MNLPNDTARRNGVEGEQLCAGCLRKIAPRPKECFMMPPALIDGACEFNKAERNNER